VSTFNHLQEPVLFQAAAATQRAGGVKRFESTYPFAVGPVDDARPYPHHFLRIESLARLMGEDRGNWLPFAEWGPITLVATLAQSVVLALLLLVVPVVLARNRSGRGVTATPVAYFLAIGFAYMATEIAAIQQMSLLLGHPVYAVMLVLATLLICSGIGSVWSDRLRLNHGWLVNGGLLLILLLFGVILLEVVHLLQPAAFVTRVVVAALLVCPLALLMGIPFPHGIRLLTNESNTHVAWAWAANGFASVVAAPLAALIALERGSPQLFFLAAIAYGLAGVLSREQLGKGTGRFT